MPRPTPILALLALCACEPESGLSPILAGDEYQPLLEVEPDQLRFDPLTPGESEVKSFTISNEGTAALEVASITIEGSAAFTVLSAGAPWSVAAGQAQQIDITYSPLGAEDMAEAVISSDDRARPRFPVALEGSWAMPELTITPQDYDFGELMPGCTSILEVELSNTGGSTLEVELATVVGEAYSLLDDSALPASLEPEEVAYLWVAFSPPAYASYEGELWVSSNDPSGSKLALQEGTGSDDAPCVELEEGGELELDLLFDLDYQRGDVAFLLDTSESMDDLALAMAEEFSNIAAILATGIPDVTFGLATFEDYNYEQMGDKGDLPFVLRQQQTSDLDAVQEALDAVPINFGEDQTEAVMEALYQGATGLGYDQDCDGELDAVTDVPPFLQDAEDAFRGVVPGVYVPDTPDGGALGGFGFREDVLPILIYATDAALRDPDQGDETPGGCPSDAGSSAVKEVFRAMGARLIAVAVDSETVGWNQMEALAEGTGSVADMDGDGDTEAAVVRWSGSSGSFRDTVAQAVINLVQGVVFERVWLEVEGDDYGLVRDIEPEQYEDVPAGSQAVFTVELVGNVMAEATARSYTLVFQVVADEIVLDEQTVHVLVPGSG